MANTSWIRKVVESHIQNWLAQKYDTTFSSKKLRLITGKMNEFDAVSNDGSIVAAILSNRAQTRGGKSNTGAKRKAECDFWRLANLDSNAVSKRLMIFTDEQLCREMRKVIGDPLALNVDMLSYRLPEDMELKLSQILREASLEQRARTD